MDQNELLDPFNRLLADACTPAVVRAIEGGGSPAVLWDALETSGFLDALAPESAGGVGLSLGAVAPLLMALGHFAVPLPVAETMVARALLGDAGIEHPQGPIVLATFVSRAAIPMARTAGHALVQYGQELVLTKLADVPMQDTGVHHSLAAVISWPATPAGRVFAAGDTDLLALGAVLRATAIAGAADRLLAMTIAHANERVQFGKPIGRQQAIQQQLAVMAEHVVATRMAAEIGCAGGLRGDVMAAATAKRMASAAAATVADIAHAVHGAIGISEELDVQLHTRRLREWRLADGGERYWAERLGYARLAAAGMSSLDFVRTRIATTESDA
ncbi:acyl-CoA dehydrogenase family protein [Sphingomonas sp. KC8]|uniref:acyl-CoA dehydrogenase family protein n=2 Tax=Sphingomonas sp. KC8 TaxID=1030157 RepID=UPI000A31D175|nr:acyl-CoA dehydrogenase family protein [Sphingomonas sp. KC8]ARS26109.1 hypothetical protein KC8_02235 [Sphingomonas sp. KC8]